MAMSTANHLWNHFFHLWSLVQTLDRCLLLGPCSTTRPLRNQGSYNQNLLGHVAVTNLTRCQPADVLCKQHTTSKVFVCF